jgi:hypothetical protein
MTDHPNKAVARIAFDGEALRDGAMNVRDLAPALIALGELVESANFALNRDCAEVKVYIRSDIRRGSFEFSIDVVQMLKEAKSLLDPHADSIRNAKDLLALIGLAGGGTTTVGVGLFKLVKWLRNRRPDSVAPLQPGETRVTIGNIHIDVKNEVIVLAEDSRVRSALANTLRPLAKRGIDSFQVRDQGETVEAVHKDEVDWFAAPDIPLTADVLHEGDHTAVFEIFKPSFIPGKRWVISDGRRSYGVDMEDKDFMAKVERREVMFGRGDAIKVQLRTKAARGDDGKLITTFKVIKVLEVLTAGGGRQRPLFGFDKTRER